MDPNVLTVTDFDFARGRNCVWPSLGSLVNVVLNTPVLKDCAIAGDS